MKIHTFLLIAFMSGATQLAHGFWQSPVFMSWGLESSNPHVPGGSITVSLQIGGTRSPANVDHNIDVDVYISRVQDSITTPAVRLTPSINAQLPASTTQGPVARRTYTVPTTFAASPTTAGTYYVVLVASGQVSTAIRSSSFTLAVPDIAVDDESFGSVSDGSTTLPYPETALSSSRTRQIWISNSGTGNLTGISVSISGTHASDFSVTSSPATSLSQGNSTSFMLRFTPSVAGQRSAAIRIASNAVGTRNPFDFNVTGNGVQAPLVDSQAATLIRARSVTLNGQVNPRGSSTSVSFDLGTTISYGTTLTPTPSTVTGSSLTPVSFAANGLMPGTTYYYRLRGSNGGGTVNGLGSTFTTLTSSEDWRLTHFGSISSAGNAAPGADANQNGLKNILEYALGSNPAGASNLSVILPTSRLNPATNSLEYSFSHYLERNDITIIVQASDSPNGPWENLATSVNGSLFSASLPGVVVTIVGTGTVRTVTIRDRFASNDPAHPRRFMRMSVSQ